MLQTTAESLISTDTRTGRRSFLTSGLALAPLAWLGSQELTVAREPAAAKVKIPNSINKAEKTFFQSVLKHENAHVSFLITALGESARPKPTFQGLVQKKASDFLQIAQALENTGVGAYLGAAPIIFDADYLAAAGSIMTIEARHAGTINFFLNGPVSPDNEDFDMPLTAAQVATAAGGFIASLNGGPDLNYSSDPSGDNDLDILNFALALEYLEAEFYNVNAHLFS